MVREKITSPNNKGVSFLELVVSLAVFSLLIILASPSIDLFLQRKRIHSTLRNISTLLHNSRFAALKSNACVVVEIKSRSCRAFFDNGGGQNSKDWKQQPDEKVVDELSTDSGITLSSNCNLTTHPNKFRYTGRIGVSPCSINVALKGVNRGKVVINSTGRVRLETVL